MGSTKIVVFNIRQLIKIGIVVLVGVVLIILLGIFLTSRGGQNSAMLPNDGGSTTQFFYESVAASDPGSYIPGTYQSEIILNGEPITFSVAVSSNKIEDIEMSQLNEVQSALYPLIQPTFDEVSQEVINTQSLNIPLDSSTATTEGIILDAIAAAISNATA